jgi:hypothetical protein
MRLGSKKRPNFLIPQVTKVSKESVLMRKVCSHLAKIVRVRFLRFIAILKPGVRSLV